MKGKVPMSEQKKDEKYIRVVTPVFRVSFPHVFKPHAFQNREPAYSIQMLFDKDADLTPMKDAAKKALQTGMSKLWKGEKPKNLRSPFKDGNEKNLDDYRGKTVVEARTKMKPGIVDKDRQEILDPAEFYAGCYARATLTCYPYSVSGNNGVSFGLNNIQKVKDGPALSGRKNAKDDFDVIEDLEDFDKSEESSEVEDEFEF